MRTTDSTLLAFLNDPHATSAILFDLYTIVLVDGTTLRYTDADADIKLSDGRLFVRGPLFKRSRVSWTRGIQVDELNLTVTARSSDLLAGLPWVQAAAAGVLDGSSLLLERLVMSDLSTIKGTMIWFPGNVANVDISRSTISMLVKSDVEKLDLKMPRNIYQASCLNTLYDINCAVNKSSVTVGGNVQASPAPTRSQFNSTQTTNGNGYYDQGVLTFTSGANAGIGRSIKSYTQSGGVFVFARPFPFDIGSGDAFSVRPGCDKTLGANGCARYANQARFRGFPFIPVAETVT